MLKTIHLIDPDINDPIFLIEIYKDKIIRLTNIIKHHECLRHGDSRDYSDRALEDVRDQLAYFKAKLKVLESKNQKQPEYSYNEQIQTLKDIREKVSAILQSYDYQIDGSSPVVGYLNDLNATTQNAIDYLKNNK